MRKRFGERLRAYWWLWAAVAVVAVILNQLIDRDVAGDKNGHPGGDGLVAIVVVLIIAGVWEFLAARNSRGSESRR